MDLVPFFWGLQLWVVEVVVEANLIHLRMAIRVALGEVVVIGMEKEAQLPAQILQHPLGIMAEPPALIVTMVAEGLVVVAQVESDKTSNTAGD